MSFFVFKVFNVLLLAAVICASKTLDPPEGTETSEELLAKEKLMKLFRDRERNIENYWTSMETPNMKPAASGHHKRADTDIEDGPAGERSKRHFLRNLFGGLFQHKHNHQQPAPQPVYQPPGINIL